MKFSEKLFLCYKEKGEKSKREFMDKLKKKIVEKEMEEKEEDGKEEE